MDTDDVPEGKKKDVSLRSKICLLEQEMDAKAVEYASQLTVRELVKKYLLQKGGVRQSTRAGYKTVVNILEKDSFGGRSISEIKVSDAKEWLIRLQQVDGRGYSSIHTIRGVVRPAFQMATNDDLIVKNPFEFPLMGVVVNDSVRREAITHDQKRRFLEFIKKDKHFSRYYEGIYILFYTGLRISEFVGLTTQDIDLEHKKIDVNHQLQRGSDMQYVIQPTKTNAGTRVIPISDDVCKCFRKIIQKRKVPAGETGIRDARGKVYKEFLYYDKNKMPMVALHWEKYFQHIVQKHNRIYKNELPKITPHVCRHTYCSHMASAGINPKYLQYLMGHSEIGVTLDVYTHVEWENVEKEVHSVMANCRKEAW